MRLVSRICYAFSSIQEFLSSSFHGAFDDAAMSKEFLIYFVIKVITIIIIIIITKKFVKFTNPYTLCPYKPCLVLAEDCLEFSAIKVRGIMSCIGVPIRHKCEYGSRCIKTLEHNKMKVKFCVLNTCTCKNIRIPLVPPFLGNRRKMRS